MVIVEESTMQVEIHTDQDSPQIEVGADEPESDVVA